MCAKASFFAKTSGAIEPTTVTRLLVISFFIAVSLGLIQDSDMRLLASPFLAAPYDIYLMHTLVFCLSMMVLIGIQRRRAALVLALVVFWSSYLALFAGGEVGAFWRDLAMIGGLIMTASNQHSDDESASEIQRHPVVVDLAPVARAAVPAAEPTQDDAYREDFNLARSY